MEEPISRLGTPRSGNSTSIGQDCREDHVISLPLVRLFYPDPDPTENYPGEAVDIEGYVITPDHAVTIAVSAKTPGGLDMLDSAWAGLRKKGLASRRSLLLDDRGRTVSVLTLNPMLPDDFLDLLRSLVVVPVHVSSGFVEVHFLATREEFNAIEERIEVDGLPLELPAPGTLPTTKDAGLLQTEDWAFLGLLAAVGALDDPDGPSPQRVTELLRLDPTVLALQSASLRHSLARFVLELFAPVEGGGRLGTGSS